jgi:hypothetical protein
MTGEIERLLTELSDAGIRYLVVGGVAVVLHGYVRAKATLELVIDLEPANIRRALQLLRDRGFHRRPLKVFSLWHPRLPGLEVDIFVEEPFPFDEAYRRAMSVQVGSSPVTVAAIDDLIAMKRTAGRAQDAADIEVLLELKKPPDEIRDAPFDGSFEGTRRRQALAARRLPPADRLRWMERLVSELRALQGHAS